MEEHRKGGQFVFIPANIKLYFPRIQRGENYIEGNKLRGELVNAPVLNANVLDHLLTHPESFPEDWKKDEKGDILYIFFWGTTYLNSYGAPCIRFLYWSNGSLGWDCQWLINGWDGKYPAAIRTN
ncbi:MAG: hypothetical protein AAB789_00795 [Patescibacteria group bacterium]